jgi:hypothetical protein
MIIITKKKIMRIDESIAYALLHGKKVTKKELKELFWPDSSVRGRDSNMTNLCQGHTKNINPAWIKIMVEKCGIDANFLFNVEPMKE